MAIDIYNSIITVQVPFAYYAVCKGLPMGKWNPVDKQWQYPRTPFVAKKINESFDSSVLRSKTFKEYLKEHTEESVEKSQTSVQLKQPPKRSLDLWSHQLEAYYFGCQLDGVYFNMDMGTGKSKVVVDIIQNNLSSGTILILAPLNVVDHTWNKQLDLHCAVPYRSLVLGSTSKEGKSYSVPKKLFDLKEFLSESFEGLSFIIINYDSAKASAMAAFLLSRRWDYLVLDEAHAVASPSSKVSKFARELGRVATRRVAMSGTPMRKNFLDLWNQYAVLDQKVFGSNYFAFSRTYGIYGGFKNYELVGIRNEPMLQSKIDKIMFTVDDSVLTLPEFPPIVRSGRLSISGMRLYNQIYKNYKDALKMYKEMIDTDSTSKAVSILPYLMKMQQLTSGFYNNELVEQFKKELLLEVLDELYPEEPVVIFCRFLADLDLVKSVGIELNRGYAELSGRSKELDKWITTDKYPILGVQIASGGSGIDLTKSRYAIYYSLGFDLTHFLQSKARVRRPGQTRSGHYIYLIAEQTIDEDVYEALDNKKEVIDALLRKND